MIQSFDADTMPNFRWTFSVSMLLDITDDGLYILHTERVTELRLWTRLALIPEHLFCIVINVFSLCLLHGRGD